MPDPAEPRADKKLPQFRKGEEIDITGGMPSEEWVRRGRDGLPKEIEAAEPRADASDPRPPDWQTEDAKLADEFAAKGTLQYYLLRRGFMPHDEKGAEAMLDGIIAENERAESRLAEVVAERDRLREAAGDALRTLVVVRAEFSVKDAIGILKAALEGTPGREGP